MVPNDENKPRNLPARTVTQVGTAAPVAPDLSSPLANPVAAEIFTNPDVRIHSSVWSWPEARPGARVAAFVLDSLIIAALVKLLDSFYLRFFDQGLPALVPTLVSIFYFIVQHKISGQTLGKKFAGIRVLPLEHSTSGVPLERVLLRETIGRAISVLTFGYGYWRIFFRGDRMGLHDAISRTRVASMGYERESRGIPVRFALLAILVVLGGGGSIAYYVITQTAYPLRELAKKLEPHGFKISGIDGTLAKGFTIDHVAQDSDDISYEINGLRFRYEIGESADAPFIFHELSAKSAKINIRKWPQFGEAKPGAEPVRKREDSGPFGAVAAESSGQKSGLPALLKFANIDVNDIEVQVPGRAPYHLEKITVVDVEAKPALKFLSFAHLWLKGDSVLIDLKEVILQEKTIAVNKRAYVQISPSLYPELLSHAIDVEFDGFFEDFKPSKLNLTAFNKKLDVKYRGESGELVLKEFTPLHYFKTELPVWNIDFKMAGDFKSFNIAQMQGEFGVRNVRFTLDAGMLKHVRGARIFTLQPRLQADWKNMLSGRDPGLILGSSDKMLSREALADAYFLRPVAKLTPVERELVDTDSRFFTDTVDAGVLPIAPVAVKAAPVTARTPASRKRNEAPPGVPTKLPAFKKRSQR